MRSILPDNIQVDYFTYVDYDAEDIPNLPLYMYKRTAFEHEKEVRAIIRDSACDKAGIAL